MSACCLVASTKQSSRQSAPVCHRLAVNCRGASMIQNTAKQTDARTVTVDPSHPLAELHMRAVMTWPTDRSKRDEAVATFAAWSLAEPGTGVAARADAVSVLRTAVEQRGYTLNDLMNDPAGRLFLRTTEQEWVERTIHFFSETMTAAGGIGAVARAPGLDSIVQKMRDVERSEMPVVGSVLCFVTQMHLHHRDVIASQNRGWAVFERAAGGKPPRAPTKEAKFKTAWWLPLRGVAPLYAAYKIAQQVRLLEQTLHPQTLGPRWSEGEMREIFGWAKWLRTWATHHKAKHARADDWLIPDNEALIYDVDVPEIQPPLGPLSPARLEIARFYYKDKA